MKFQGSQSHSPGEARLTLPGVSACPTHLVLPVLPPISLWTRFGRVLRIQGAMDRGKENTESCPKGLGSRKVRDALGLRGRTLLFLRGQRVRGVRQCRPQRVSKCPDSPIIAPGHPCCPSPSRISASITHTGVPGATMKYTVAVSTSPLGEMPAPAGMGLAGVQGEHRHPPPTGSRHLCEIYNPDDYTR